MTTDEILEAAKEAGLLYQEAETASRIVYDFAAIIERIVERKTIEKCAVVCEMRAIKLLGETEYESAKYCAAAIRKLGDE